jgi:HEAT repeat protein/cyclophilin family peptidyl-prolyl cis-trans isomerase
VTRTISLSILATGLLAYGCASAPRPATGPPPAPFEQSLAWIVRLEDQRMLRGEVPSPPPEAAGTPRNRRAPAAASVRPAVPDLLAALTQGDPPVRRRAALAVGRVGLVDGIVPLTRVLSSDADPEVRQMAAFALGLIGQEGAAATLVTALKDPSPLVQGRAAEALGAIGAKAHASDIAAMMRPHVGAGALRAIAPDDLTYPLAPEVEAVRLGVYAFARLKAYDALASIVLTPEGQPVSEWWPVAYALGRTEDPRAAAALTALTRSGGTYTRAFAARGLGHVKASAAVPVLLPLAEDVARQPLVALEAVRALAALEAREAAPVLVRVMGGPALDPAVRTEVIAALGRVGSSEDSQHLLDFLTDQAPGIRAAAFRALGAIDREAFLSALSGLDPDRHWTVRAAVASALGTLDPEQAVPLLLPLLKDQDQRAVPAVLSALAAVKAPDVERLLLDHLRADDPIVRAAAATALGELRPAGAAEALAAAYRTAERDPTYVARGAIIGALAKYERPAAEPTLTAALADKDWAVRVRAASLLQTIDPARNTAAAIRPAPTTVDAATIASSPIVSPPYSTHVYVDTDKGTFQIELAVLDAPLTAFSFITLARKGYFDGLSIHRVVPGFVLQDGDPRGDGEGGPGYTLRDEINERPYLRGTVGMALDWKETGGSQYFITYGPQPQLDGRYTVFGQVIGGIEVVEQLRPWDVVRRVRVWDGVR